MLVVAVHTYQAIVEQLSISSVIDLLMHEALSSGTDGESAGTQLLSKQL